MSRKSRVLFLVICCVLFAVSCKRQQQGEQTVSGHKIHLEKDTIDTGLVSCYADSNGKIIDIIKTSPFAYNKSTNTNNNYLA